MRPGATDIITGVILSITLQDTSPIVCTGGIAHTGIIARTGIIAHTGGIAGTDGITVGTSTIVGTAGTGGIDVLVFLPGTNVPGRR
jgi:hypothetical protein